MRVQKFRCGAPNTSGQQDKLRPEFCHSFVRVEGQRCFRHREPRPTRVDID